MSVCETAPLCRTGEYNRCSLWHNVTHIETEGRHGIKTWLYLHHRSL